ncbi:MAG: hypothetical protein JW759_04740 [Candidatus Coatesbacteria bacterium]|nr:hypothetical protein [Candidatus Coatesbacteria bacterium]
MDARLRLLYFLALAVSLFFAKSATRLAILAAILASVLFLFKRASLRRPHALIALTLVAGSVFVLHCFFPLDGSGVVQFSPVGCQKGARLSLTVVSLWAAATLLFGAAMPRELTLAIAWFLPFARRPGSFSHSFISLVSNGLLIFPACRSSLAAARTSARARGSSFCLRSPGRSRRNTEEVLGFALRRLCVRSDEIIIQLACRGHSGLEAWLPKGDAKPISASQIVLFAAVTAITVAMLIV